MKNKDMKKRNLKSTRVIKSVLCLFIGLLFSVSVKAQNCQIIDSTNVTLMNVCDPGGATGSIELVMPVGNYSFLWNSVSMPGFIWVTEDISFLSADTITLTITNDDSTACSQDTSFVIIEPQDPLSSTVNPLLNVLCHGDSSGVAKGIVIGGYTQSYSYQWNNIIINPNDPLDTIYHGDTTQTAVGLWAGTHTVTFTDANGCILVDNIVISENDAIVGNPTTIDSVSCFGACDGIVELSSSGGINPYDYDWDNGQSYHGNGPDTATALCYGGHDIIITDALGCREIVSFIMYQPDELFTQAVMVQPVQCYGFDDGMAFASATGGTTPYSFVWDSINGPIGQNIDSLIPGIHTVYVTDAKGCTHSDTVVITEPTQLEVIIEADSTIFPYCAGTNSGKLCALASGGTPTYNYMWNDNFNQTTPCATDLRPQYADYTIVVMDDRDCIATASFQLDSITDSMEDDNSVSITITDTKCFGELNGSVEIDTVIGGIYPYNFSWTGPPQTSIAPTYESILQNISSVKAGVYAVVIEDVNGCSITRNAEVEQPVRLEYTTYNVFSETCYGACDGKISVLVQGGTGDYYYDETQAGIFPINSATSNNWVQLINDSSIFNLCSDLHSVYITDENNCEAAVSWGGSWQEQVGPGVVVSIAGVSTQLASCFNTNDGQAEILSPNPLLTYTWETLGGTVIETGVETSLLYSDEDYMVVAHYTDSASFGQIYTSCDDTTSFTTPFVTPLLSGEIVTAVSCFGLDDGKIVLSPTSPATVLWDTTTSIPGSSTALSQSPLQPGTYTVTITANDGCIITNDIVVEEPDAITASISFTAPSCNGLSDGDATIIAVGGTGVLNIAWTSGGGNNATTSPIAAGIYTANVTDVNFCGGSFSVVVTEPEAVIASLENNIFYNENDNGDPYHISCFGASDGSAIVSNGGGVPPLTYSWSSSSGTAAEETGLSAGPVTVIVTDFNDCADTATIILIEPTYLDPNIKDSIYSTSTNGITNEISCYGFSDGWLESQTIGGVETPNETYQYKWVNDSTGETVSFQAIADYLPANTSYTVTVTDANGCVSNNTSSVLDEPLEFLADVTTTNYGGPTHAPFITNFLDNTSSNDPFDFNWTWEDGIDPTYPNGTLTFEHKFVVENIGENNVYVIVTNLATSCFDSVPFVINVQGVPDINNVFTPNGDQYNNEFYFGEHSMVDIDVQVFNRWGQLVYSWSGENKSWDGKGADGQDLPEAVYFYVLKAEGTDGYYYDKKGSVTLLR